ncbi:Prolyl endopeptidase FAP [Chionoecetes opilio]|uniref:Prolyl endopeptidase FAP n=1 Tax=Chionoecetes opilio TaxID=41210 RepID=A0A8J5CXN8_CHIOP|nr:Prolyl endopeptidase FAP [Chionoecetes opilio]
MEPFPRPLQAEDDGPKRNWIGILISLAIIGLVLVLVTIATFIVGDPPPLFTGRRLVITDLQDPALIASPMGTQWVADDQLVYLTEDQGIRMLNIRSRMNITLVTNIALGRLYTRTAEYSIYDVTTDHYYPLKLWRHAVEQPRFQHVAWVGDKDAALVVVHEANLYLLPAPNLNPVTLTHDANPNLLYNGVPDILYEGEGRSWGRNNAVWPSPTGAALAAATFNESGVRQLPILVYSENVYPTVHNLRYPTVNTPIPEVWLWVYDLKSNKIPRPRTRLVPPEPITQSHYLVSVGWVNGSTVWVSWTSRDQSTAVLTTCQHPSWNCSLVGHGLTTRSWEVTGSRIGHEVMVHVNHKEGGGVSPVVGSVVWAGSWAVFPWCVRTLAGAWHNHVALVGASQGVHAPLTLEDYHVTEVLGYHTNRSLVYFRGSVLRNGAGRQQVYSVQMENESVSCVTCQLGCPFVEADPNPALTYMVVTCRGADLPSSHLLRLPTKTSRATSTTLHRQEHLRLALKDLALPVVTSLDVALEPALHAAVTLTLPPGWSSQDDTLLYPLVVQMVGPGEQDVDEPLWHLGWREYLSSGHQVAHARVQLWGGDPSTRASTHTLARHQADVVRKMLEMFTFLDGNNVGAWGWGSGASLALDAAATHPALIKCVAAVNPVVDWRAHGNGWRAWLRICGPWFDPGPGQVGDQPTQLFFLPFGVDKWVPGEGSFWAERLLGTSTSEGSGRRYEDSDLTRLAPSLGTGRVLLAHGTRDPAAHHAFLLAHALITSDTYFTHVVYTDDDYMLDLNRYHLINAFTQFFFTWLHDPLTYELQEA